MLDRPERRYTRLQVFQIIVGIVKSAPFQMNTRGQFCQTSHDPEPAKPDKTYVRSVGFGIDQLDREAFRHILP